MNIDIFYKYTLILLVYHELFPTYNFPAIKQLIQKLRVKGISWLSKFSLTKKGNPDLKASVDNCDFISSCNLNFSLMLSKHPLTFGRQWRVLQSQKYFIINFVCLFIFARRLLCLYLHISCHVHSCTYSSLSFSQLHVGCRVRTYKIHVHACRLSHMHVGCRFLLRSAGNVLWREITSQRQNSIQDVSTIEPLSRS